MLAFIAFVAIVWLMITIFRIGLRAAWGGVKILCAVAVIPIIVLGLLTVGLIGVFVILAVLGYITATIIRQSEPFI